MTTDSIFVVIPSLDPNNKLIDLCNELLHRKVAHILIVDDGSGAAYQPIFDAVKKSGCTVLRHDINLGKGRALKDAFQYILKHHPECIGCVTADSDGQHSPEDICRCIDQLRQQRDSLILGCRRFDGPDVPSKSKFGNELTKKVFKFLYRLDISDTQTGLRGIPRHFMEQCLSVPGERFEFETNMLIATVGKIGITELPIETIYDSKDNHVTHFRPIRDSLIIYRIFGKDIAKYLLSSLSSCALDLLVFSICTRLLKNSSATWYIALSTIIARIISSFYNYSMNYLFVFKSKEHFGKSAVKYYLLAVAQMSLSALLVSFVVKILGMQSELFSKIIVDSILLIVSFYVQKHYIF